MAGLWRPWRELRQRPDVTFQLIDFPPGPVRALCVFRDAATVVLIDRSLSPADRQVALAHELVHVERGPVPAGAPAWIVAKEERQVDRLVGRRLVPVVELRRFVEARSTVGPVSVFDVAEQFDVSLSVARRACDDIAACP